MLTGIVAPRVIKAFLIGLGSFLLYSNGINILSTMFTLEKINIIEMNALRSIMRIAK